MATRYPTENEGYEVPGGRPRPLFEAAGELPPPAHPKVLGGLAPDILLALPTAIYLTDADGRITFYNQAAVDLWGVRPELGKSAWCGSWRLYWPDGRPMPHDECPMAVALKTRKAISGAEAIVERPDGTRVTFIAYPTPLFDGSGVLAGAVSMLIDASERLETERSQQLLAAIVESSEDAIVSKDLNGVVRTWNRAAGRVFGYSAEEMIGQPIMRLIPADLQDEETEILRRIRSGERIEHYDTIRRRKDGSLIDVSLTVSPVRNRRGEIIGASKIARDVTERRRAEEQQRLLLREMNHRVKNVFSLASGVVTLTSRYAQDPKEMAEAVRQRIGALARAHELTLPTLPEEGGEPRATTLDALMRTIATPYLDAGDPGECVAISGPSVTIGGSAVTSIALLLHELATNAAKYGALCSPTGRVKVDWQIVDDELHLTWRELGGPEVPGEPEARGFGTVLADTTVERHFDGKLVREWNPEGLVVRLSVPLAKLGQ